MQQSPGTLREHPTALPLPPVGTRSWNPAGPSCASRRSLPASPRPFSPALPLSSPRERPRPFALAVAGPRCAFPPSLLGAPALPLPTLRRSWLPVQHSPLSHRWVFVSVCLLSLCPAGLLSCSLLDPTTASPRGWEGNRCSVKCLLGDRRSE